MNQDLKTTDDSKSPGKWNAPDAQALEQLGTVNTSRAAQADSPDSESRQLIKGTFPEDIFAEDAEGREIFAQQTYCPSFKMTLIAVIILALLYFIFF